MLIECPGCHHEYDLELDDVVVEMVFSCPNCKARFLVKNSEGANVSLIPPTPPSSAAAAPAPATPPPSDSKPQPKAAEQCHTPPTKPQSPTPSQTKRRSRYAWVAAVVVLLLLVGGMALRPFLSVEALSLHDGTPFAEAKERFNVVLALDISTSMLAEDLQPNRIEAVKAVLSDTLTPWRSDSVGLVVFAGEVLEQCPLTDQRLLLVRRLQGVNLEKVKRGDIEDGTAIGMGLACAVARLRESSAQHKAVVLFTDGSNNRGEVSPMAAANLASRFGVQVFTVAVGTTGSARYPLSVGGSIQYVNLPVEIDTLTLKTIATTTGGCFYRAASQKALTAICRDIRQQLGRRQAASGNALSTEPQLDEKSAMRLLNMVLRQEQNTRKRVSICEDY